MRIFSRHTPAAVPADYSEMRPNPTRLLAAVEPNSLGILGITQISSCSTSFSLRAQAESTTPVFALLTPQAADFS